MSSYLVTGAGRGLGFQFVQLLSKRPASEVSTIFATVRASPSSALQEVAASSQGRVVIVHLVPTDTDSIARAVEEVKQKLAGRGLDVLINNAGMMEVSESVEKMNNLRRTLELNVESVHNITAALLPLLRQGTQKKVLNLSSSVCVIADSRKWTITPHPAYKISKVALNSLTVQYALELEKDGFAFVVVCPGWVRTEMGGEIADLDPTTSAAAVLDIIAKDAKEINGKFLKVHVPGWENAPGLHQYNGGELPW